MTDITPSASSVVYGVFDGSRAAPIPPSPADAAVPPSEPPAAPPSSPPSSPPPGPFLPGRVQLNKVTLRRLREAKCLSQEEMVNDFQRRNLQVSIATIKRVETGHPVRFRILRELARYYGVSFDELLG